MQLDTCAVSLCVRNSLKIISRMCILHANKLGHGGAVYGLVLLCPYNDSPFNIYIITNTCCFFLQRPEDHSFIGGYGY